METLPNELLADILAHTIEVSSKNELTPLRLVCKAFDQVIKPLVCETISLDFTRLSKRSGRARPQVEALQTVGYQCKNLYIDLMVLRDETEVDYLENVFRKAPIMTDFCRSLKEDYSMKPTSFTTFDYYSVLEGILFNCRGIETLRLNLPFQIVGRQTNAGTMILANTLKAFAKRPPEDSSPLRTLILESVTDVAIIRMWTNPTDVLNILAITKNLRNLVITLRRQDDADSLVRFFSNCFWSLIESAQQLESFCLTGLEMEERPPLPFKRTYSAKTQLASWLIRTMPTPLIVLRSLTRLELKRVELTGEFLIQVAENFSALEELYLNEIYLKADRMQILDDEDDPAQNQWIGPPNTRPPVSARWIAMGLRVTARRLRVCRASHLCYDNYSWGQEDDFESLDDENPPGFDLRDPCGLGRSIAQRFVGVVMGIQQPNSVPTPNAPTGSPVRYLPASPEHDEFAADLKARTVLSIADYDTNAYQLMFGNTTSKWQKSVDGRFPNCNQATLDELHRIAETAYHGLHQVQGDRDLGIVHPLERLFEWAWERSLRGERQDQDDEDEGGDLLGEFGPITDFHDFNAPLPGEDDRWAVYNSSL